MKVSYENDIHDDNVVVVECTSLIYPIYQTSEEGRERMESL